MPWLEIAAVAFTLAGIWMGTRRYVLSWPVTIIAILLYALVFYRARLYSDTLLQAAFFVFAVYGWVHWRRGLREEGIVRVEPLDKTHLIVGMAAGAAGSALLGYLMANYTNAVIPHVDSTLTSFSLVATWWQTRKHLANWTLWIVLDCIYTGVFIYKHLYWTAILYLLLVLLAMLGLRDWRRAATTQQFSDAQAQRPGACPGSRF